MKFLKRILITALMFSLTMQSFASQTARAMEVVRHNYTGRMRDYNASPTDGRIPGYTGTLNKLFARGPNKEPVAREKLKGIQEEVLKAIMGTALIHGDNMLFRDYETDLSKYTSNNPDDISVFKHFAILGLTQRLSQALAMQIVYDEFSTAYAVMGQFDKEIRLLKEYGGIESDELKTWFEEVYKTDHAKGLTHEHRMHWRDPALYKTQEPASVLSSASHAASEQKDGNPFRVDNNHVAYNGKQVHFTDFTRFYEPIRALKGEKEKKEWLISNLPRKLEGLGIKWSSMDEDAIVTLCTHFVSAFKQAYYKLVNPGNSYSAAAKKDPKISAQNRAQVEKDLLARNAFLRSQPIDESAENIEIAIAIAKHFIDTSKSAAALHQDPSIAELMSYQTAHNQIAYQTTDGKTLYKGITRGDGRCAYYATGVDPEEFGERLMYFLQTVDAQLREGAASQSDSELFNLIIDTLKEEIRVSEINNDDIRAYFKDKSKYASDDMIKLISIFYGLNISIYKETTTGLNEIVNYLHGGQASRIKLLSTGFALSAHFDLLIEEDADAFEKQRAINLSKLAMKVYESTNNREDSVAKENYLDEAHKDLATAATTRYDARSQLKAAGGGVASAVEEEKESTGGTKTGSGRAGAIPAVERQLEFIKEKLVRGLLNSDNVVIPDGEQALMPNGLNKGSFKRAYDDIKDGPATYLDPILGSSPDKYNTMMDTAVIILKSEGLPITKANLEPFMGNAMEKYGTIGSLGLYLHYIKWAKENKIRKTPGYLGFDAGFPYNISHEENGELKPHTLEIARFKKNAEEAFSAGYISYAAVVKNQRPGQRSEHFWCIFATKNKDTNTIKDIYVFNPTAPTDEDTNIDWNSFATILLPLAGDITNARISSGEYQRTGDGIYTGNLHSFFTGTQSESMACGITSTLLADHFIRLPLDQIETREKIIQKLREFQDRMGYKDKPSIIGGLHNIRKLREEELLKKIRNTQTQMEADLCEGIRKEFVAICERLAKKTINDLPAVLQEYITDVHLADQWAAVDDGSSSGGNHSLGSGHSLAGGGDKKREEQLQLPPPPKPAAVEYIDPEGNITAGGKSTTVERLLANYIGALKDLGNDKKIAMDRAIQQAYLKPETPRVPGLDARLKEWLAENEWRLEFL